MKRRKQEEDIADLLIQALKESMEAPDFIDKMGAAANNRDILFNGQRPNDKDYGYSSSNPIMTSTIPSNEVYLKKLRTRDGHPFTWKRVGSMGVGEIHGVPDVIVDKYTLYLDGREYKEIYICPYGHNSSFAPFGMKLEGESTVVNKSDAPGSQVNLVQAENAGSSDKNHVSSASVKYCRQCGALLVEGAAFCRQCGKQVTATGASVAAEKLKAKEFYLVCPSCGNQLRPGQKFCNQCGASLSPIGKPQKVVIPEVKKVEVKPAPVEVTSKLSFSGLSPLLRRAFIFIEDEEWDRADEYLEKVLDENPENAYAYLGKAMVAVKVVTPMQPTEDELAKMLSRKEYTRAKRYADAKLKGILDLWENMTAQA